MNNTKNMDTSISIELDHTSDNNEDYSLDHTLVRNNDSLDNDKYNLYDQNKSFKLDNIDSPNNNERRKRLLEENEKKHEDDNSLDKYNDSNKKPSMNYTENKGSKHVTKKNHSPNVSIGESFYQRLTDSIYRRLIVGSSNQIKLVGLISAARLLVRLYEDNKTEISTDENIDHKIILLNCHVGDWQPIESDQVEISNLNLPKDIFNSLKNSHSPPLINRTRIMYTVTPANYDGSKVGGGYRGGGSDPLSRLVTKWRNLSQSDIDDFKYITTNNYDLKYNGFYILYAKPNRPDSKWKQFYSARMRTTAFNRRHHILLNSTHFSKLIKLHTIHLQKNGVDLPIGMALFEDHTESLSVKPLSFPNNETDLESIRSLENTDNNKIVKTNNIENIDVSTIEQNISSNYVNFNDAFIGNGLQFKLDGPDQSKNAFAKDSSELLLLYNFRLLTPGLQSEILHIINCSKFINPDTLSAVLRYSLDAVCVSNNTINHPNSSSNSTSNTNSNNLNNSNNDNIIGVSGHNNHLSNTVICNKDSNSNLVFNNPWIPFKNLFIPNFTSSDSISNMSSEDISSTNYSDLNQQNDIVNKIQDNNRNKISNYIEYNLLQKVLGYQQNLSNSMNISLQGNFN